MGQLILDKQLNSYKRCNLQAIQGENGRHRLDVLDTDEIMLVDTGNHKSGEQGYGEYDAYVVGDNHTPAYQLTLHYFNPQKLSELEGDSTHRTVTDSQIATWNNGTGGGGSATNVDNEDLALVEEDGVNVIKFKDKEYSAASNSGLGRVYVRKNIETVNVAQSEKAFSTLRADDAISVTYGTVYNSTYDNTYYAQYKAIIEADTQNTFNTDAVQAAETAYAAKYQESIENELSVAEATRLANIEYEKAYHNVVKSITADANIEKNNIITPAKATASSTAVTTATNASMDAVHAIFPSVEWTKKKFADGRFTESGGKKYLNLTKGSRPSVTNVCFDVYAGEVYKIYATKSDYAGDAWTSRLWTITEKPQQGDTRVEVLQAYKLDNEDLLNKIVEEVTFVNVEHDGTLWINYIAYPGFIGICEVERIRKTQVTETINTLTSFTEPNTEYIIQYDYDLAGNVLELPENSVLKFEGGSISNGYIKGNNSSINAFPSDKVIPNVTIIGTWRNEEFYSKWFGAVGDGVTDDSDVLQRMLDLSGNIGKRVELIWRGYTYKTTKCLYLKSNTVIRGGSIIAEFENPLDWIMQTYALYSNGHIMNGISKLPNHAYIASWQEFDGKDSQYLQHITGTYIYDLSLDGKLNKHLVVPDPELYQGTAPTPFNITNYIKGQYWTVGTSGTYCDVECNEGDIIYCRLSYTSENGYKDSDFAITQAGSERVWDGTYCPIYGGLKLNGASCPTNNVAIRNTAIGIARGACLHSYDIHLNVGARFLAYAARAMNTSVVVNSYLNAWCNYYDSSKTDSYTPYYLEYQGFNKQPSLGGAWTDVIEYIEGNGGIDNGDGTEGALTKPKLCSVKLNYAGITFINTVTDSGAEVGFAATNSTVVIEYPYFEGVSKCYVYAALTRVSINMPEITSSAAEYDFIGNQCSFVLNNCSGRISGSGGTDGENHKYKLGSSGDRIQILGPKYDGAPEDDRFVYLSAGDGKMQIISASENSLTAVTNKYYKFSSAVNTLAITLPSMTGVTSVKGIMIYLTTGSTPNITFTSADSKPIYKFDNYEINMNSTYEINCMYNGSAWVIGASEISTT